MKLSEFRKLPLSEKFNFMNDSKLYYDLIFYDYVFMTRDDLNDDINGGVADEIGDAGCDDIRMMLNRLRDFIDSSHSDYFYRELGEDYWDEPRELTDEILMNIISEYSDTEEYKEAFSVNENFDGLDGLL